MGTFYVFGFPSVESHEGYAARKLSSGELTRTWIETDNFTGHVAACDCGWRGEKEYPPTPAGDDAAIEEWKERHMRPLIPSLTRKAARQEASLVVAAFERAALDGLEHEPEPIKPLASVAALSRLVSVAEFALEVAVSEARRTGATWSALGDALGTSKQAAQQRFG